QPPGAACGHTLATFLQGRCVTIRVSRSQLQLRCPWHLVAKSITAEAGSYETGLVVSRLRTCGNRNRMAIPAAANAMKPAARKLALLPWRSQIQPASRAPTTPPTPEDNP